MLGTIYVYLATRHAGVQRKASTWRAPPSIRILGIKYAYCVTCTYVVRMLGTIYIYLVVRMLGTIYVYSWSTIYVYLYHIRIFAGVQRRASTWRAPPSIQTSHSSASSPYVYWVTHTYVVRILGIIHLCCTYIG